MVNEQVKFVVVDLETSGLKTEDGEILEVAVQTVDEDLKSIHRLAFIFLECEVTKVT